MNIDDILKDSNPNIIDAEKMFDSDGNLIEGYLDVVQQEKPITPTPKTADRLKFFSIKENRDRYTVFPERLPTKDLLPQPIDAHELIGMFENNHTLYLTTANAFNKVMERIETLERKLQELKDTANPL
jgi:hypothetical protein